MSSTHCEVLIKASRKKITEYERQLLEFDFDKLKLTNNRACAAIQGQICLHSMHKYLPKVHVRCEDSNDSNLTKTPTTSTFVFPETVFTTVTAYQNQQVTTTNLSLGFEICFRCLSNK